MSRSIGFIMLVIVAAVGAYLYTKQANSVVEVGSTPQTTVEVTAVRNDLLRLANAERRYWVSNGKYATLDELRTGGDISLPVRANYSYSAQATETGRRLGYAIMISVYIVAMTGLVLLVARLISGYEVPNPVPALLLMVLEGVLLLT